MHTLLVFHYYTLNNNYNQTTKHNKHQTQSKYYTTHKARVTKQIAHNLIIKNQTKLAPYKNNQLKLNSY